MLYWQQVCLPNIGLSDKGNDQEIKLKLGQRRIKTNKNQNEIKLNKQPSNKRNERNRKIECEWQQ